MKHGHPRESYNSLNDSRQSSIESLRERNGLILGTDIREPMMDRESVYSPYEVPAFFIPSVGPNEEPGPLTLHQIKVMEMHDLLIAHELSGSVSPSVLAYIRNSIHSRMVEQVGLNSHCYLSRLNNDVADMPESCITALAGTANVAQAAEAREIFGMVSAPLAEITIIGDKRAEHLDAMNREVSEYVGHDIREVTPYRMEVLGFDRDPDYNRTHHLGAMRVMMKRHHGQKADGVEVKQRTLAIIDLSSGSGVDPAITRAIFDAYRKNKNMASKKNIGSRLLDMYADQDEHLERLYLDRYFSQNKTQNIQSYDSKEADVNRPIAYADLPEVRRMLDALVERDMKSSVVLARNETIYEYDENIDKQLKHIWRFPITS